ncbi:hypothetical protein MKEN_01046200 [Mycena kentingensis (nom. inval.)]|nr:hypothetical protein MKEN_01046200 [Mycena kentingensis (nom. inval.)]
MSALPLPVPPESTYGVRLVALLLELILYGMGIAQTSEYFMSMPDDSLSIQFNIYSVVTIETVHVIIFVLGSYYRFVERFHVFTGELFWFDSLQLICAHLSVFFVQIFFATRAYKLAKGSRHTNTLLATYTIFVLAATSIGTGIAQAVWVGAISSFAQLGKTKALAAVQAATSLACDILISCTICIFFTKQKGEIKKTNHLLDLLIFEAINRGILSIMSSGINLGLFIYIPGTFWFCLGVALRSKIYMISMLWSLTVRQYMRDQVAAGDKGWNSLQLGIRSDVKSAHSSASGVEMSHHSMQPQGCGSEPTLGDVHDVVDSRKE